MCEWGRNRILRVPISPELAFDGQFRWDYRAVDLCISDIVQALNDAGIYTANSCCGHGREAGSILLHDGRELIIKQKQAPAPAPEEE